MEKVDSKNLRDFGLLTGTVIGFLFGLLLPWLKSRPHPLWPWILAFLLILSAFTKPFLLRPIYQAWMKLGHLLGWVNSRIILGLVFYLIVTPMGLFMRKWGKNPLENSTEKTNLNSYRRILKHREEKHMEVPY